MKSLRLFSFIASLLFSMIAAGAITSCTAENEPGDVNVTKNEAKDVYEEPVGEKTGEGMDDNLPGADR